MSDTADILQRKINYLSQTNLELKRKLFDFNTVFEISRNLNSILDVEVLLDSVLQSCINQLDIESAALAVQRSTDRNQLDLLKTVNLDVKSQADLIFDCDGELIRLLKSSSKYISINQIAKHLDFLSPDFKKLEILKCQICVPLISKSQIRGILILSRRKSEEEFKEEDLGFISMLSEQITVAIENAILYQSEKKGLEQLKNTQRQLIQSEKLAVLGQFSASIAHEINNPLGIIKNYLLLLSKSFPPKNENRANLEIVKEEVDRIARIVKQLLDLCQPKDEKAQSVDLGKMLGQTIHFVEKEFKKHNILIVPRFSADLPVVEGHPDQLKQLFMNLLMNAKDSMPQGGNIRIDISMDGDRAIVEFSDTGCGIPKENMLKVFQPFFTTKDQNRGTGLGLWICSEIVNQHNGTITLKDTEMGTTFVIKLPIKQG